MVMLTELISTIDDITITGDPNIQINKVRWIVAGLPNATCLSRSLVILRME